MSTQPADPGGGGGDDLVVTDRQLFESALENPAPQPELQPAPSTPSPEPPAEPQQEPQQAGLQPRNERGQFAPRQPQAQPQQPPPQGAAPGGPGFNDQVPLRTYLDERERRYRIQAEADQMRNAWAQLQQQQYQAALAAQQQAMPQTIYDNPDMYLQHNVVQPLRNEGHMAMLQIKDGLSREMANAQFGAQNVNGALQA